MAEDKNAMPAKLEAELRLLHATVLQVQRLRDAILHPVLKADATIDERKAYADTMGVFAEWCVDRGVSFPLTVGRLVQLVMDNDRPSIEACDDAAIDKVIDKVLKALDAGPAEAA